MTRHEDIVHKGLRYRRTPSGNVEVWRGLFMDDYVQHADLDEYVTAHHLPRELFAAWLQNGRKQSREQ